MAWKVEREAKMEPPIQTEYFLSGLKKKRERMVQLVHSRRLNWFKVGKEEIHTEQQS
jgi:hypothetical protein